MAQDSESLYLKHYQLVYSASIVILMQLGFTFLEVGSVRVQFTKGILMKNMVDMTISALMYFAIGFGLAFGDGSTTGGMFGTNNFFLRSIENDTNIHHSPAGFVYHWSYCATAATIVAGAVAERTQLVAYCVYSVVGSTFLYPVITHWIWAPTGWASAINADRLITGVLDDAGGICVHVCAGTCSLVACYFVGPRQHRLSKSGRLVKELPKQNHSFIVFGMFVLWFSWYAFNAGPAIIAGGEDTGLIGRIAAYTTICAASSGTTYLLISVVFRKKIPEPSDLCNGILAGLVCSTSACSITEPCFGIIIGSVGGVITMSVSKLMLKLKIDDVVDAVAVHLGCGIWSAISAPFFAGTRDGHATGQSSLCGIFTGCKDGWKMLGSNVLLTVITIIYVAATIGPVCILLRHCKILRIKVETEKKGVDQVEFEGSAYNGDTLTPNRFRNSRNKKFPTKTISIEI